MDEDDAGSEASFDTAVSSLQQEQDPANDELSTATRPGSIVVAGDHSPDTEERLFNNTDNGSLIRRVHRRLELLSLLERCGILAMTALMVWLAYATLSSDSWSRRIAYREDCRRQNETRGLMSDTCADALSEAMPPLPKARSLKAKRWNALTTGYDQIFTCMSNKFWEFLLFPLFGFALREAYRRLHFTHTLQRPHAIVVAYRVWRTSRVYKTLLAAYLTAIAACAASYTIASWPMTGVTPTTSLLTTLHTPATPLLPLYYQVAREGIRWQRDRSIYYFGDGEPWELFLDVRNTYTVCTGDPAIDDDDRDCFEIQYETVDNETRAVQSFVDSAAMCGIRFDYDKHSSLTNLAGLLLGY
ncbi:hypothetical protein LTR70_006446 [Exophiala xenobiotica]|uniref:Uncharacterized protein n=1 Tax=Lithohypha guttulata TaxID=1690604 RepID=A0ABR0K2K1_9EURO|nr:hypothetical protein LTR24_007718 [Lithohypha guttulata]KAK5315992.1 hypothetical protein LTR70_006446 [Exophiala xenobiotica]